MKKIALALAALTLLTSCGDNPSKSGDEGKAYIEALQKASESSLKKDSYYFSTPGAGGKLALGVKDLDGTYYHVSGSSLSFDLGLSGLRQSDLSSYEGLFELKGGSLSLDTNSAIISDSYKNMMTLSPLKAKAYFDGDAAYFNASGEKNETNATLGLLVQTAIQAIPGNKGYVLYGGGSRLDTKSKYKGKWSLSGEDKAEANKHLPLIEDDADYSSVLSSLASFLEGAYEDESGKTAFYFETKEDGGKKISFQSVDKEVLSHAFASAISKADISSFASEETSLPTYEEAKEKADKFLSYAEPKAFALETYFDEDSLTQTRFDVNFSLDEAKIKELYPEGMFEVPSFTENGEPTHYNLDGTLSFSGNVLCSFSESSLFSLPEELSSYKEFPAINWRGEAA